MFDSTHLHIAIASDENYARFVATLITSVIKNNSNFQQISFHLLSNGISETTLDKIKASIKYEKHHLIFYDISDLEERLSIEVPKTIALTAYARLFMNRIISEDIDKVLYLDTDIIVVNQLDKVWNIELEDNLVAGCLDIFEGDSAKIKVGLSSFDPYFNSGVLLINLKQWRNENIDLKFVDFLKSHNGKVYHHDQGIINGVCKDRITILPPEYNLHSTVFSHPYSLIVKIIQPYYKQQEYDNALEKPVIIHFTEGFYNRPWKNNCTHPYRHAYKKYQNLTLWKGTPLLPDNRSIAVRVLSYTFLKLPYPFYKITSKLLGTISKYLK